MLRGNMSSCGAVWVCVSWMEHLKIKKYQLQLITYCYTCTPTSILI